MKAKRRARTRRPEVAPDEDPKLRQEDIDAILSVRPEDFDEGAGADEMIRNVMGAADYNLYSRGDTTRILSTKWPDFGAPETYEEIIADLERDDETLH